jgi:O-antigen/teichoic acid export membrane protein
MASFFIGFSTTNFPWYASPMHRLKEFLFNNNSIRQTVLKNTFWIGASTTVIKIARAVIIIYAARIIGTQSYGAFTYAMGLAAIFAVVSDIGLSTILVRELSKNTERIRQYFSTGFILKLSLVGIMIGLILGLGPLLSKFSTATVLMPIIALSIAFDSLRSFLYSVPRSQNRMQHEALINIATEIFCIALILIVFLHSPSAHSLAYALMIGNALGFGIACVSVKTYIIGAQRFFTKNLVVPLLRLTAPFAILSIFGIFMTNIDSVIIGMFGNEHMLGLYGAAQRPFNILYVIPGFLSASLLPIMSRFIQEGNISTVNRIARAASTASITIALPLVVGGILVATPLISVIFGSAYIDAVPTFQILLFTLLFVFPGTIFAEVLLAQNKQRIFIFTGILGAVLNVGLNFLLIPLYGIVGSAIATVIAQAVVNICFYIEMKKTYDIPLTPGLLKSVLATLGMALCTYGLLKLIWPLVIILLLSGLTYIGLLLLMKDRTLFEIRQSFR